MKAGKFLDWQGYVVILFLVLLCLAVILVLVDETKKRSASENECGDYRIVATREVDVWLPFRGGLLEVTCGTSEKGVSRTVVVRYR